MFSLIFILVLVYLIVGVLSHLISIFNFFFDLKEILKERKQNKKKLTE